MNDAHTLVYARSEAYAAVFRAICAPDVVIKVIPEPRVGLRIKHLVIQPPREEYPGKPLGFHSWDEFEGWAKQQQLGVLPDGKTHFLW